MNNLKKYSVLVLMLVVQILPAQTLTMEEAVATARRQGVPAMEAKYNFVSSYWAWRSYKASRLPSIDLYGNIGSINRSLTLLQDYETGDVKYTITNNMQNSLGLSLTQNIPLTGGTVSIYSDLSRIDQYGANRSLTWYSQPVTATYSQPLFGYNKFKWNKLLSPKEYERARRVYVESMEKLSGEVVTAYFNLALAVMRGQVAENGLANTARMLSIARERMKLGSVKRDDCLQLELRVLNDSIAANENEVAVREARMALNSLLGFDESFEAIPVVGEELPDLVMDYDFVLSKALANSSFDIDNEIDILNAQSAVAQAKADRGITMLFHARFGLSKTDRELRKAYEGVVDQEVVGLSFRIPIFDWGTGRGKVQKAQAAEDVVRSQVEQERNDFRRRLFTAVGQFNNQRRQCWSSCRARDIAEERYTLVMDAFGRGESSVTDLNTARIEYDNAITQFVTDISNYWNYYYAIRQLTLYDFVAGTDIEVNPEELMEGLQ